MSISMDLRILAKKLENNSDKLLDNASYKGPEVFEKITTAVAAASTLLESVADDMDNNADFNFTEQQLDEIAALATSFDQSNDPLLKKQASVLDELLLSIAAPKNSVAKAKQATEDEINRLRKEYHTKRMEEAYDKPREVQSDLNNKKEIAKAVEQQVKRFIPMEAPLQTRYPPDRPGGQMTRISDNVYQDILTGIIYDFKNGYTTQKGNVIPGSCVENQNRLLSDYINQGTSLFETRESINGRYAKENPSLVKTANTLTLVAKEAPELLNQAIEYARNEGLSVDTIGKIIGNAYDRGEELPLQFDIKEDVPEFEFIDNDFENYKKKISDTVVSEEALAQTQIPFKIPGLPGVIANFENSEKYFYNIKPLLSDLKEGKWYATIGMEIKYLRDIGMFPEHLELLEQEFLTNTSNEESNKKIQKHNLPENWDETFLENLNFYNNPEKKADSSNINDSKIALAINIIQEIAPHLLKSAIVKAKINGLSDIQIKNILASEFKFNNGNFGENGEIRVAESLFPHLKILGWNSLISDHLNVMSNLGVGKQIINKLSTKYLSNKNVSSLNLLNKILKSAGVAEFEEEPGESSLELDVEPQYVLEPESVKPMVNTTTSPLEQFQHEINTLTNPKDDLMNWIRLFLQTQQEIDDDNNKYIQKLNIDKDNSIISEEEYNQKIKEYTDKLMNDKGAVGPYVENNDGIKWGTIAGVFEEEEEENLQTPEEKVLESFKEEPEESEEPEYDLEIIEPEESLKEELGISELTLITPYDSIDEWNSKYNKIQETVKSGKDAKIMSIIEEYSLGKKTEQQYKEDIKARLNELMHDENAVGPFETDEDNNEWITVANKVKNEIQNPESELKKELQKDIPESTSGKKITPLTDLLHWMHIKEEAEEAFTDPKDRLMTSIHSSYAALVEKPEEADRQRGLKIRDDIINSLMNKKNAVGAYEEYEPGKIWLIVAQELQAKLKGSKTHVYGWKEYMEKYDVQLTDNQIENIEKTVMNKIEDINAAFSEYKPAYTKMHIKESIERNYRENLRHYTINTELKKLNMPPMFKIAERPDEMGVFRKLEQLISKKIKTRGGPVGSSFGKLKSAFDLDNEGKPILPEYLKAYNEIRDDAKLAFALKNNKTIDIFDPQTKKRNTVKVENKEQLRYLKLTEPENKEVKETIDAKMEAAGFVPPRAKIFNSQSTSQILFQNHNWDEEIKIADFGKSKTLFNNTKDYLDKIDQFKQELESILMVQVRKINALTEIENEELTKNGQKPKPLPIDIPKFQSIKSLEGKFKAYYHMMGKDYTYDDISKMVLRRIDKFIEDYNSKEGRQESDKLYSLTKPAVAGKSFGDLILQDRKAKREQMDRWKKQNAQKGNETLDPQAFGRPEKLQGERLKVTSPDIPPDMKTPYDDLYGWENALKDAGKIALSIMAKEESNKLGIEVTSDDIMSRLNHRDGDIKKATRKELFSLINIEMEKNKWVPAYSSKYNAARNFWFNELHEIKKEKSR